jgi:hypothetical protein
MRAAAWCRVVAIGVLTSAGARAAEPGVACDPTAVYVAECALSEALVAAWQEVGGGRRSVSCTVRVTLDARGRVASHEVSDCADPALMVRALRRASPIRIRPNNACVREKLSAMTFALSGDGRSATSRH